MIFCFRVVLFSAKFRFITKYSPKLVTHPQIQIKAFQEEEYIMYPANIGNIILGLKMAAFVNFFGLNLQF